MTTKVKKVISSIAVAGAITTGAVMSTRADPAPVTVVIDKQTVAEVKQLLKDNQNKQIIYVATEESELAVKRFLYDEQRSNPNVRGKIIRKGLSDEERGKELSDFAKGTQ